MTQSAISFRRFALRRNNGSKLVIGRLLIIAAAALLFANSAAAQSIRQVQSDLANFAKLSHSTGGNVLETDGVQHYQWPGIYFEARFDGPKVYFKIDDNYNRFRVFVDENEISLLTKPQAAIFEVSNLSAGAHKIRIIKISESQNASGRFYGFYSENSSQPHEPSFQKPSLIEPSLIEQQMRSRKIEFIGDSYLVGYGNLSPIRACPGSLYENTDNSKSYGQIVARHFNADLQINAYSGIGMARNYNNNLGEKNIEYFYGRPIFDHDYKPKNSNFKPNIIFVALGTNDFSTPIKPDEKWKDIEALRQDYVNRYLEFLLELRTKNPKSTIIIAVNLDANTNHLASFELVKKEFAAKDANFHAIYLPKLQNTGCDWHPNLNDHLTMAQVVISKINDLKIRW